MNSYYFTYKVRLIPELILKKIALQIKSRVNTKRDISLVAPASDVLRKAL